MIAPTKNRPSRYTRLYQRSEDEEEDDEDDVLLEDPPPTMKEILQLQVERVI